MAEEKKEREETLERMRGAYAQASSEEELLALMQMDFRQARSEDEKCLSCWALESKLRGGFVEKTSPEGPLIAFLMDQFRTGTRIVRGTLAESVSIFSTSWAHASKIVGQVRADLAHTDPDVVLKVVEMIDGLAPFMSEKPADTDLLVMDVTRLRLAQLNSEGFVRADADDRIDESTGRLLDRMCSKWPELHDVRALTRAVTRWTAGHGRDYKELIAMIEDKKAPLRPHQPARSLGSTRIMQA